jgi:arylsulfatase A-like enzyme
MIARCMGLTLLMVMGAGWAPAAAPPAKPNVLMIILDDLNDWCGCLGGHPDAHTPNIDRLARRGVLFAGAHCTSPICGPSRAAVLTGMRPETTGVYHNRGTYVDYAAHAVSVQKHFMAHGYRVLGAGKVNHGLGMVVPGDWHEYGPGCGVLGTPFVDDELDCTLMNPTRTIHRGRLQVTLPMNGGLSMIDRPTNQWDSFDWGPLDLDDDDFPDGRIAAWAAEQLSGRHDGPLFLAVGFYKPHQPFFLPQKYFQMLDAGAVRLPPTMAGDLDDVPQPGRDLATRPWTSGTHKTVVEHGKWREAVHAYLATITFADAQAGRVIDALDRGPQADNTWVVLWSDHGWSLGEKEHWGKHVPWRESVRQPLIIIPPRNAPPAGFRPGSRCEAMVNLLDLYPTLIEACGLSPRGELEGRSLVPLVGDPGAAWPEATVTTIGRGSHSVCTRRWRYVRYFDGSEELYDLQGDPREWVNLADDRGHAEMKRRLARHVPEDKNIRQFVRWGGWKCVFKSDGGTMLFDTHATFGISEQDDVADRHPEVVTKIAGYLRANKITARRVCMPESFDLDPEVEP